MGSTHLPHPRRATDYYSLLGVSGDAPFRDIEQAYWREAIRSRELIPMLNQAYEVLGDPQRRAEYDAARVSSADQTAKQDQAKTPRRSNPELRSKLRW
jgi:DnaJ-class molecular chaperone